MSITKKQSIRNHLRQLIDCKSFGNAMTNLEDNSLHFL
nr:MAG TPA: hypothetical protein [Bacteriophage sp.]DAZ74000.1 MAG TPA: hypothetical protein [Caudoviricetes sp.]